MRGAFMNDEFVGSYLEVAQFSFENIPSKAKKSKQKNSQIQKIEILFFSSKCHS